MSSLKQLPKKTNSDAISAMFLGSAIRNALEDFHKSNPENQMKVVNTRIRDALYTLLVALRKSELESSIAATTFIEMTRASTPTQWKPPTYTDPIFKEVLQTTQDEEMSLLYGTAIRNETFDLFKHLSDSVQHDISIRINNAIFTAIIALRASKKGNAQIVDFVKKTQMFVPDYWEQPTLLHKF